MKPSSRVTEHADTAANVHPTDDAWPALLRSLIRQTTQLSGCDERHKSLLSGLQSFLRILKRETEKPGDPSTAMLLHLLTNYSSIICDPGSLRAFKNNWNITSGENALLCLVGEWMGKRMYCFTETIAQKVEEFKSKNMDRIYDLPPSQILIENLFPMFMKLLIGHWIGLYKSADQAPTVEDSSKKGINKPQQPQSKNKDHSYFSKKEETQECSSSSSPRTNRDDHSYFNPVDSSTTSAAPSQEEGVKPKRKVDHSYSNRSNTSTEDKKSKEEEPAIHNTRKRGLRGQDEGFNTEAGGSKRSKDHTYFSSNNAQVPVEKTGKKDHTYVTPKPDSTEEEPKPGVEPPRKDHTYQRKTRKTRARSPSSSRAEPAPPVSPSKRKVTSSTPSAEPPDSSSLACEPETRNLEDPSKYPFVQLVLEFMNNALISGLSHVVYTKLTHSW